MNSPSQDSPPIPSPTTVTTDTGETAALSAFVRRQTPDSRYSHFAGAEERLLELVRLHWPRRRPGYRPGVALVPVPPEGFFQATVRLTPETRLHAEFTARREGEERHLLVTADAPKTPARFAEIVLYHRDVLAEDGDRSTGADWEVISINAADEENVPMHPLTLARNFLHQPGGTRGDYTADQFARSIWYWSQRCAVRG